MIKTVAKIFLISTVFTCVIFAQNNYTVKTKLSGNNIETERTITVSVIKNGQSLYSISKTLLPYYSIPQTMVFENGNLILLHSLEGTLEFYNSAKNLIAKKGNLITSLYDEHKILFSKTATEIALLISEDNENKIVIYNSAGELLFSENTEKGIANGIVLSNENNKLATSLYNWENNKIISKTFIIDLSKNQTDEFPILFKQGFFNKSGDLFCGFTNKKFFNVDLLKKKIILTKNIPDNKILMDVQVNKQNTYYIEATTPKLIKGIWIYNSAEVLKIDKDNKTEVVKKITDSFSNIHFKKDKSQSLKKGTKEEFSIEIIP